MASRQKKQCPAALCLYKMGSIPNRNTANPDVDENPDDESLGDRRFTDVSDGFSEDSLIEMIDARRGELPEELRDGADDDGLDLIEDLDAGDEANCDDEAEMIRGIEQSPWNGLQADPANVEVRIAQKYGDVAETVDRLPSRIGSRRAASLSAAVDAEKRPPTVTWKSATAAHAQYLRHNGRSGGNSDSESG